MGAETVSTHTVKNDATTTIVTRTTTIVSEHEEILAEPKASSGGVVENVKRTFRDYWFPSHSNQEEDDEEEEETEIRHDPSLLRNNSVVRRAYDYWKSLTQDADEAAKQMVIEARKARDEAAIEAKWAILGYKKEAREKYEAAEKKYKEALANAERVHGEAHEKAKSKWFQTVDSTEREVGELKDKASEITHQKWDRFKAAVNSFAFNPPKYGCSPSSQYWFSSQPSTGWDCREIWDHPNRHDHRHVSIKSLPKKYLPVEKVHDTLTDLWHQAAGKAKHAPSVTSSFDSSLKSVKDQYHSVLDRIYRNEQGAIEELDELADKIKAKLNEAKYYEEQTDAWLTSQWNAVIDNAGESKDHYQRALKKSLKNIKHTRDETYKSFLNNMNRSLQTARASIHDAYRSTKDQADKSRLHKAIKDATESFTTTIKEAEAKAKAAPRNAYEDAIEAYNRDTAHLKAKLEHAASVASKSASSASRHATKSGSSVINHASKSAASLSAQASKSASSLSAQASKSASSLSAQASKSAASFSHQASKSISSAASQVSHDAKSLADEAHKSYQSATDKARHGYEQATSTVSSMWGSATSYPAKPLHKAHDQYHRLLGNVHSQLFREDTRGEMNASSMYGAFLAIYLLFMAQRIWRARRLSRMADPKETTITIVKNGDSSGLQTDQKTTTIEKFKAKPGTEDALEKDRSSISIVQMLVGLVTLVLLVLLEHAGFSRVALHSLFIGLITSQLLQGGALNGLMMQMGITDGVHASSHDIGIYMSWAVLGLAALTSAVKPLQ